MTKFNQILNINNQVKHKIYYNKNLHIKIINTHLDKAKIIMIEMNVK